MAGPSVIDYQRSFDRSFDRGMQGVHRIAAEEARKRQLADERAYRAALVADERAWKESLIDRELQAKQAAAAGQIARNTQAYVIRMAQIEELARSTVLSDPMSMAELTGKDSPLSSSDKKALENGRALSTLSAEGQALIESRIQAAVGSMAAEDRVLQDLVKQGIDWSQVQSPVQELPEIDPSNFDLGGGSQGGEERSDDGYLPGGPTPPEPPHLGGGRPRREPASALSHPAMPSMGGALAPAPSPVPSAPATQPDAVAALAPNFARHVSAPRAADFADLRGALTAIDPAYGAPAQQAPRSQANPDEMAKSLSAFQAEQKRRAGGRVDSPYWNPSLQNLDQSTIDLNIQDLSSALAPANF